MLDAPIAVAMSGGVDSSTVAALLVRDGRQVIGLTMQLWNQRRLPQLAGGEASSGSGRCCSLDDVYDARRVAEQIGIPYYVVNFEEQFEERVVKPFVEEYLAGRTPVPCTLCNNYVKFDRFLELADSVGARHIATGHYARVRYCSESGRYQLLRAVDGAKDQSYFLFGLSQQQLARTLFPLGEMTKPEVRELAQTLNLAVAAKSDSQEICFVPNGDYAEFLTAYLEERGEQLPADRGPIVTTAGRVLGEHPGVHHFTVGQRRGLGVAAGEPLYVISTDPQSQRVVVGGAGELLRGRFFASEVNWISISAPGTPTRAQVKIRNKHAAVPAWLEPTSDPRRIEVVFDEPQRAVTPGQGAVFYQDELVLGGGWIE
jgi:tRNA-specific 2-thiouridylase